MFLSYLRTALRNLLRSKIYSLINIGGLALGFSCFMSILLFVELEHSFDRFHDRAEDIYRVAKNFVNDGGIVVPDVTTPPALAPALREELPEVEAVTRFVPNRGRLYLLEAGDKRFYETNLIGADDNFFKVFNFQFARGSRETAFKGVHSVVLTETTAKKYFGETDPINKVIRMNLNNGTDFVVSAILKDIPQNSHFSFDLIIPFESTRDATLDQNWDWYVFLTYAKVKRGTEAATFESNVRQLFARHQPNSTNEYFIQALTDIHLKSKLNEELSVNGNIFNVRIMAIIGLVIILIATINYVNLVTAQSAKRAKEIGIRKVTGAHKSQLIRQLLTETCFTVIISLVLSIAITTSILPLTQSILNYDLYAFIGESTWIKVIVPPVVLLIAILAGIYPALVLSSFEPIKVLKGSRLVSTEGIHLRQGLVLFQFIVSTGLIIASLTIVRQLNFMNEKELGFDDQNIVMLPNVRGGIGNDEDPGVMVESMRRIPGVINIARADGVFGSNNAMNGVSAKGSDRHHIPLNFFRADHEFLPALKLKLIAGRNFSDRVASDSDAIILNKQAVLELGLKPPYIGQQILWDDAPSKTHDVTIIGVVDDFHFNSFREAITPFGFIYEANNGSTFFLRIESKHIENTVARIGGVWSRHFPERPFIYSFQDDTFSRLHINEKRFEKLFAILTGIAILITCLGMFGLITYLAESKTKEIGIRKVLGATVSGIVLLLSRNFLIMVLVALTVTSPIAYYIMQHWLSGFAYRVTIDWKVFVVAGIVSVTIAFLTVGFHAIKAALANPVKSLRNE